METFCKFYTVSEHRKLPEISFGLLIIFEAKEAVTIIPKYTFI